MKCKRNEKKLLITFVIELGSVIILTTILSCSRLTLLASTSRNEAPGKEVFTKNEMVDCLGVKKGKGFKGTYYLSQQLKSCYNL